jgi:hypothetical protein
MKQFDNILLNVALQVDQQIATCDQIDPREPRITQQITRGKDDQRSNLLVDPITPILFGKKTFESLRRNMRCDISYVKSFSSFHERMFVQIAGKHLDAGRRFQLGPRFDEQHREKSWKPVPQACDSRAARSPPKGFRDQVTNAPR